MSFTQNQKIGNLGENLACKFLEKQGYKIINRNYRKKWGEIDIIAAKDNILHFVEVKTVSRESSYLPEENIHPWKRKRLGRAIQTYLLENPAASGTDETDWQVDSLAVILNQNEKEVSAKIRIIENIIL